MGETLYILFLILIVFYYINSFILFIIDEMMRCFYIFYKNCVDNIKGSELMLRYYDSKFQEIGKKESNADFEKVLRNLREIKTSIYYKFDDIDIQIKNLENKFQ